MLAVVVAALVLVVSSVVIHLAGFRWIFGFLPHTLGPPRLRVAVLVLGALVIHLVEIGLFAAGYGVLASHGANGHLQGEAPISGYPEHFYYSAVVYTTLGFGDITPVGDLRLLSAFEALTGLVLITWTASAIFLVMQRYWTVRSG